MPELPEVETTLRGIAPFVDGQTIRQVTVRETRMRWPVPVARLNELKGQKVVSLQRRAKYILLFTAQGVVLIHLGMSGSMRVLNRAPHDAPQKLSLIHI